MGSCGMRIGAEKEEREKKRKQKAGEVRSPCKEGRRSLVGRTIRRAQKEAWNNNRAASRGWRATAAVCCARRRRWAACSVARANDFLLWGGRAGDGPAAQR